MTTQYNWNICNLNCYPEAEGETDVVFQVNWQCGATDGTLNASSYGSVQVTYAAGDPFVPYADLTQDQVFGWVWASGVDKDAVEANLQKMIDEQKSPTVITPTLPWQAAEQPVAV